MAPSGGSGGTPPTRRSPRKKAAPAAPVAGNIMHLLRRVDPPSAPANVSDLGDAESMPPPAPRPRAEPGALGSARDPSLELWATKHVPTSEATLVVAKKKLDVLREWLAGWDAPRRDPKSPRVLLVVGPPGSGKSAAIRFAAREFGRDVHEWRAPVPTLWEEHRHAHGGADGRTTNATTAPAYASKLDDFAAFVQRASRYAPLACVAGAGAPSSSSSPSALDRTGDEKRQETTRARQQHDTHKRKQPVLLVEDLPVGGGEDQHRRALDLLARLAREARVPAAVAISEEDAGGVGGLGSNPAWGGGGEGRGGGAADVRTTNRGAFGPTLAARSIVSAMEAAGAKVVAFNPATAPKLVKALAAVAAAERVDVDDAGLAAIAAAAEGDVRCALASLQMFAAGRSGRAFSTKGNKGKPRSGKRAAPAPRGERRGGRRRRAALDGGGETDDEDARRARRDATAADGARRDRGLSVFHALGKILHNKRDEDEDLPSVPSKPSRQNHGSGCSSARGDAAARDEEKRRRVAGAETPKDTDAESVAEAPSPFLPLQKEKAVSREEPFTSGKPARVTRDETGALWFGSAVPPFPLHARFRRGRTKYGEPETILARARFGAERATTFLFENFAEGLRDDAVEDAAAGAAYLSDAAWFASAGRSLAFAGFGFSSSGGDGVGNLLTDGNGAPADPGAVGELVAGSVATRGLLFAPHPSRPSLRGFRAFKGPQSARAHRAAVANLQEVRAVVAAASGGDFSVGSDRTAAAAETLPMLRVIAGAPGGHPARDRLPTRWVRVEDPATAGGSGPAPLAVALAEPRAPGGRGPARGRGGGGLVAVLAGVLDRLRRVCSLYHRLRVTLPSFPGLLGVCIPAGDRPGLRVRSELDEPPRAPRFRAQTRVFPRRARVLKRRRRRPAAPVTRRAGSGPGRRTMRRLPPRASLARWSPTRPAKKKTRRGARTPPRRAPRRAAARR